MVNDNRGPLLHKYSPHCIESCYDTFFNNYFFKAAFTISDFVCTAGSQILQISRAAAEIQVGYSDFERQAHFCVESNSIINSPRGPTLIQSTSKQLTWISKTPQYESCNDSTLKLLDRTIFLLEAANNENIKNHNYSCDLT